MKKRILIVAAIVAGLAGLAGPASAGGYWGCAGSDTLNVSVCLRDPVPDPLPTLPGLPQ